MACLCSVCKRTLSEEANQQSMKSFGRALCSEHQKTAKANSKPAYRCSECKNAISHGEFRYSINHFDKALCFGCQPEEEEKVSAPPQKRGLNNGSLIEFGKKYP